MIPRIHRFIRLRGVKIYENAQDAVDSLGGIGKLVKKGDKVLVKINICGGVPERMGTFTSIEVADVLADLILSVGGKPTFANADMVWIKFWQAAKDSGFVEWAKQKRVDLVNLSETKIVRFDFGQESALGIEKVSQELIDANVIISVPTMKTHLLTGVTLGMKNMYGSFPDIDKARFHKKSIEHTIMEVNSAFTPNLTIIDGSIGGEAIGSISATPLYYETIIVSNDAALADSIEWNASLVAVSVAVESYLELLGSMAGYWTYRFHETLAIFFALSWAMNTMAVHGLAYVLSIDLEDLEERRLLPRTKEQSEPVGEISHKKIAFALR